MGLLIIAVLPQQVGAATTALRQQVGRLTTTVDPQHRGAATTRVQHPLVTTGVVITLEVITGISLYSGVT